MFFLSAPADILAKLILMKMNPFKAHSSTPTGKVCAPQLPSSNSDRLACLYDDTECRGFVLLSLDFSKAFDHVVHMTLLGKLLGFLLNGFLPRLKSYLSDRPFEVKVKDSFSSEHVYPDSFRGLQHIPGFLIFLLQ